MRSFFLSLLTRERQPLIECHVGHVGRIWQVQGAESLVGGTRTWKWNGSLAGKKYLSEACIEERNLPVCEF